MKRENFSRKLDFSASRSKKKESNSIFKKPHEIKAKFKKFVKPNDYTRKTQIISDSPQNSKFFSPNPKTPDFARNSSLKQQSKRDSRGHWFRAKGQRSQYIAADGECYSGYNAFRKSLEDKQNQKKRILAEIQMKKDANSFLKGNAFSFEFYGIPDAIVKEYQKKGVTSLFEWQVKCLASPDVLNGKNLVYSAPTSGGKTLVAEILMIRRMMLHNKKCLFVLPFVSLVQEKARDLKRKLSPLGYVVRALHSTTSITVGEEADVIVCTVEKANLILNKLMEEGRLQKDFGIVVIDELHIIGDEGRGYILELMLTKLMLVSVHQQIIGLSATMPNISELASWLNASLFLTDFRPVPLREYVKVKSSIYDKTGRRVRSIKKFRSTPKTAHEDAEDTYALCEEVISKEKSVLIFCPTKEWCKSCARMLSLQIRKHKTHNPLLKTQKREVILERLRQLPGEVCPVLMQSVPCGVAYHHAGMTVEEREIVENAFRDRGIDILTATSTLAAGVNLPAFRVIFRHPSVGNKFLSVAKYKQMSGRAGRAGIDESGESIVISTPREKDNALRLLNSEMTPLKSVLALNKGGMCRIILEAVTSKVARTDADIEKFARATFLQKQSSSEETTAERLAEAFSFLLHHKLIQRGKSFLSPDPKLSPTDSELLKTPTVVLSIPQRKTKKNILDRLWEERRKKPAEKIYFSTQLGNAAFFSGLNPRDAVFIKNELARARKGFVLKGSLHICYLVTPTHHLSIEPNWAFYFQIFGSLSPVFHRTALRVGVDESFLSFCSYKPPRYQSDDPKVIVHRRFFASLLLFEIVNEHPLHEISARFGVERGKVQALQNSAASFSRMVALFCERLNWSVMASLLSHFCERLTFGVQSELLPLLQIPHVKSFRARALFDSGLCRVEQVAAATVLSIKEAISKYDSFEITPKTPLKNRPGNAERNFRAEIEFQTAKLIKKGALTVLEEAIEKMEKEFEELGSLGTAGEMDRIEDGLQNCRQRRDRQEEETNQLKSIFDSASNKFRSFSRFVY